MKLTLDLIESCPQVVNPSRERMLVLRGQKITMLENLAVTRDQYGSIDLSSNEIGRLDNIPPLPHLRSLLLSNNRISRISEDALSNISGLSSLVLTNNRFTLLQHLRPLGKLKNLERLSLSDNPVTQHPDYRAFILKLLPSLHFLDFTRITDKERLAAKSFVIPEQEEEPEEPTSATFVMTPEISSKIRGLIESAKSMDEISRLERILKSGTLDNSADPELVAFLLS